VRVGAEAPPLAYHVIIEYPQHPEIHPVRVVVAGKTEGMMRVEPAMIGMATGIGSVDYGFHDL